MDQTATDISVHPYAKLFPRMGEREFEELKRDILIHGIRQPIVMYQHLILDGRHRFDAGFQLGVECPQIEFEGDDDAALAFVLSTNLHRRHLTESQRAMVAAKLATMRMGDNQHCPTEGVPIGTPSVPLCRAAKMMNVGRMSAARARAVMSRGVPELVAMVERGNVAVSAAAEVVQLPVARQRQVVEHGSEKIVAVAREQRTTREKVSARSAQLAPTPPPRRRKSSTVRMLINGWNSRLKALWFIATPEERRVFLEELNLLPDLETRSQGERTPT